MDVNPFSSNFFPCLMEKYRDKIVEPYKSCEELLDTLKLMYCFELISYEEAMIEMRGFITDNDITKEKSTFYLLKPDNSSEIFYRDHTARFFPESRIILLLDKDKEKFIANNHLFQLKVNILRGINREEADNFTHKFKEYLNFFYVYDMALKNNNITNTLNDF